MFLKMSVAEIIIFTDAAGNWEINNLAEKRKERRKKKKRGQARIILPAQIIGGQSKVKE